MFACPPVRRSFSDEHGPGTFHSLGDLPKRKHDTSTRKSPVFHIPHDDDDDHSSSLEEHSPVPCPATVHFPISSPNSPPTSPTSSTFPCPPLSRGASSPVLLSNGKLLKPSLKSSSSSPAMLIPTHTHFRARSEPSTPKNVHFPEKDFGLATVRFFNRSARPDALSNPNGNGNGDETETEGEDAPPTRFPFPSFPPNFKYEIDPTNASPIPSKYPHSSNLILESLNLSSPAFSPTSTAAKPVLTGSILVRNLAFEKHVAIRFTLDDWQTISEVGAHYVDSLSSLPSKFSPSPSPEDSRAKGWDRFIFAIRLEDYAPSLSTRTLWLAARYHVNSIYPEPGLPQYGPGGEWWDNNGGENYRIGFRPAVAATSSIRIKPRRGTVSAPVPSPRTQIQSPITCKEHALGLMVPFGSHKDDRRSAPPSLRTGKLNLCNYVPPTVRAPPSISLPSAPSMQSSPPSENTKIAFPQSRSSSDEESPSPASSTLSTPTVSPTILPRHIIGGQPATSTGEDDEDAFTRLRPGHITDWDWSARDKPRIERPSRPHVDLVPGLESFKRHRDVSPPPGGKVFSDSTSVYEAFVTQWCFARGPSPNHHSYDGGDGIMA